MGEAPPPPPNDSSRLSAEIDPALLPPPLSGAGTLDGLVARFAHAVVGHPVRVIAVALVISIAAAVYAAKHYRLDTDRGALIGLELDYNKRFKRLEDEFGDMAASTVVVAVRGHDGKRKLTEKERDTARAFADALDERLKKDRKRFGAIFYRVPEDAFRGRALLFLEKKDLEQIASQLSDLRFALNRLAGPDGLGGFFDGLAAHVRKLMEKGEPPRKPGDTPGPDERAAFLTAVLDGATEAIEKGAAYETPWRDMMPKAVVERDGYAWTADQRLLFLVNLPKEEPGIARAPQAECVAALRAAAGEVAKGHPGVDVGQLTGGTRGGLTGEPVLATDEMETYEADARWAMVAGVFGVTLLLLISYRRIAGPLLLVICLLMAVALTIAFSTFWPGHLNLLSIVFLMILVGFGIDFGIHLISRYDEERTFGMDHASALEAALRLTGRACAGGAITTAIAFACMLLADFQGIREFGVLAGAGTIFCLITMLGVLPAFVVLADKGRAGLTRRPRPGWARTRLAVKLDRIAETRPTAVIVASVVVAAASLGGAALKLKFDGDLLSLQAVGLESTRLATDLLKAGGETGMFACYMAENPADMHRVEAKLAARKDLVDRVSTIEDVVPADQVEKLALIKKIAALCESIPGGGLGNGNGSSGAKPAATPDPRGALARLAKGVREFDAALETAQEEMFGDVARKKEFAEVGKLRRRVQRLADAADPETLGAADAIEARWLRLEKYEQPLRRELGEALGRLKEEGSADKPLTRDDLPPDVRERFIGKTGKHLVRVFPKRNVFEDAPLAEFVTALEKDVPEITGVPVQIYETSVRMKEGYERAGRWALLCIAVYLLFHYRHPMRAAITIAALLVGAAFSLGALTLLGQTFNPANMLAIPLTLGIGVSYAIQLVHRHRQAHAVRSVAGAPPLVATSTGRGVVLSAATNVVGFGALALAHHRGTMSIGIAITIGVLGCLLAALAFLPALLRAWTGPVPAASPTGPSGPKIGPEGRVARVEPAA